MNVDQTMSGIQMARLLMFCDCDGHEFVTVHECEKVNLMLHTNYKVHFLTHIHIKST